MMPLILGGKITMEQRSQFLPKNNKNEFIEEPSNEKLGALGSADAIASSFLPKFPKAMPRLFHAWSLSGFNLRAWSKRRDRCFISSQL
jgi:hypothetical protein